MNTPQQPPPEPEHGDWRRPTSRPAEAEHLPPPLSIRQQVIRRVQVLQAAPVGAYGHYGDPAEDDLDIHPIAGRERWLRLALAWLVLLPLQLVMAYALLLQLSHAEETVGQMSFWLSVPVWYSLLGVCTFAALVVSRVAMPILVFVYVLGHELTHAIAAKLCLGKVQTLRIDLNGGYVETDADNLFIALSPYFVPLWMLCWLPALWLANLVHPFPEWEAWFYAGFGFWWSFHLYWTVWVIPREQPDMLENGLLFSLLLVMIMNMGVLLVVLFCFGVITPAGYAHDFMEGAQQIIDAASALIRHLRADAVGLTID